MKLSIIMKKNIFLLISFFFVASAQIIFAQNNTNSPYTRFGYGEITEGTPTELRGMGGVGLANRSFNTINAMNPASYTSVDSLTFMFDLGASLRYTHFSAKDLAGNPVSNKTLNANLEYLTFRFPFSKSIAFSAGLLPYSFVGHNYSLNYSKETLTNPSEDKKKTFIQETHNGKGGFSEVYGGLSVSLFEHISLGINAYYLFGTINNNISLTFSDKSATSSLYKNEIKANDFRLRYGLQAYNTFAEKHKATLGIIYEAKSKLDGNYTGSLNNIPLTKNQSFEIPQVLGLGLNYSFDNKLTVGVDYIRRDWNNTLFFGKTDTLATTNKIGMGLEYIPNPTGRIKYSDHIRYRAGFNIQNQYFSPQTGVKANDFVFSLGVGLPTKSGKTIMNFALEYGKSGSKSLIKEDFIRLSFSTSINEFWFFKPIL